jgi:hypothetical protein
LVDLFIYMGFHLCNLQTADSLAANTLIYEPSSSRQRFFENLYNFMSFNVFQNFFVSHSLLPHLHELCCSAKLKTQKTNLRLPYEPTHFKALVTANPPPGHPILFRNISLSPSATSPSNILFASRNHSCLPFPLCHSSPPPSPPVAF